MMFNKTFKGNTFFLEIYISKRRNEWKARKHIECAVLPSLQIHAWLKSPIQPFILISIDSTFLWYDLYTELQIYY